MDLRLHERQIFVCFFLTYSKAHMFLVCKSVHLYLYLCMCICMYTRTDISVILTEIKIKISKSVKRISFCPFPVVNPSSSRVITAILIYTPTRNLKLGGFLVFVCFFFFFPFGLEDIRKRAVQIFKGGKVTVLQKSRSPDECLVLEFELRY